MTNPDHNRIVDRAIKRLEVADGPVLCNPAEIISWLATATDNQLLDLAVAFDRAACPAAARLTVQIYRNRLQSRRQKITQAAWAVFESGVARQIVRFSLPELNAVIGIAGQSDLLRLRNIYAQAGKTNRAEMVDSIYQSRRQQEQSADRQNEDLQTDSDYYWSAGNRLLARFSSNYGFDDRAALIETTVQAWEDQQRSDSSGLFNQESAANDLYRAIGRALVASVITADSAN